MSGGYDSTAVAGAVAALCRERPDETPRVAAISATFGDLPCDESARIDIALAETGLAGLRTVPLGRGIDPDAMRRHVARHDAPFVDFQAPLLDACGALAREHGFATLMTGLGGVAVGGGGFVGLGVLVGVAVGAAVSPAPSL